MMVQAKLSAPSPFRSSRPETKIPTAQLVSIRLAKNAASARPSAQRLKPKKAIASSVTGTMPIASRTMLMIISAATNSAGRSGDIMRLPRLRAYISSRNEIEKPSWPRNRISHSSTAPMKTPPACAKKPAFCESRSAGSPTSASAPPASRSARACAATTSAADTSSAAPSRRRGGTRNQCRYR